MLLPDNIGISMSIDETSLNGELYTILTNKAGHGKAGTIVAMIKGTRVSDLVRVLNKLPEEKRMMVCEISMDFSDSMRAAVKMPSPAPRLWWIASMWSSDAGTPLRNSGSSARGRRSRRGRRRKPSIRRNWPGEWLCVRLTGRDIQKIQGP